MKVLWLTIAIALAAGSAAAQPPAAAPGPAPLVYNRAEHKAPPARVAVSRADTFMASHRNFNGVVLVAKDGAPVFRKAYGYADREWGVKNTPETKFRIGSITKSFTAAAIIKLQEEGKLSVDDPVSKYYPAAPAAWSRITLKHLLQHQSGIPNYTNNGVFMLRTSMLDHSLEQMIAVTRDRPLDFEPGSRYSYSNSGYVLLGHVIEKASGKTYADYLQATILNPLGLKDTGYDSSTALIPRRAQGYDLGPNGVTNARYLSMTVPHGAGAIYSTVDDLLKWDQALTKGAILSEASRKAMFTPSLQDYGFGWNITKGFDHPVIAHSGGIHGFSSMLSRYVEDGVTVVVLSNQVPAPTGQIAQGLAAIWLGVPPRRAAPGGEEMARHMLADARTQKRIELGELRSLRLISADANGDDRYLASFAQGDVEVGVRLATNGTFLAMGLRPVLRPDGGVTKLGPAMPPRAAPSQQVRVDAFRNADKNGDGKLDKAEYQVALNALGFGQELEVRFAQRDVDRDGFVSQAEYDAPGMAAPA